MTARLIFLLTSLLIWPLYTIEYLNNWASIESAFIEGARHLTAHWPHPRWQPDWFSFIGLEHGAQGFFLGIQQVHV